MKEEIEQIINRSGSNTLPCGTPQLTNLTRVSISSFYSSVTFALLLKYNSFSLLTLRVTSYFQVYCAEVHNEYYQTL